MLIAFGYRVVIVVRTVVPDRPLDFEGAASMVSAMTRLASGDVTVDDPGPRPPRRDRRNGRRGRGVQEQHDRGRSAARRAARGRGAAGRAAQGRHAPARRCVRRRGRRDRRDRVLGLDRTRSLRHHADADGRAVAGSGDQRRGGLRGSLHQRAVGRLGERGIDILGQRDQPPGPGIGAHRQRGRRSGAARPTSASASCRRRPAASATWSN